MKKIITLLILSLFTLTGFSQGRVITGTVTDESGAGIPGVTVLLVGTGTGTITDLDGKYSLSASQGTLRFSYIGYTTQEVPIGAQNVINVVLVEEMTELNEVVVIGYGVQQKKDLTTAVVVVDDESFKDRAITSAAQALQGKAAGVQVTSPSGKPGGTLSVRVRGATSVLAGNEPLYVVDGVPTTDIRGLNPNDIASLTVLKDASSAVIYGARAANGVVLITTKRGSDEQPLISFNTYYGISNIRKTIDVLTTRQYRDLMIDLGQNWEPTWVGNTDWKDEVFGTGNTQSYQLSVSGGDKKAKYFISGGYLADEGIVKPARFDRYSFRVNLDNEVRSWLKFSTSINYLHMITKDTPDNLSSGRGGVIMSTLNTPPFLRIYNEDSTQYAQNPFQASWENPIAYMFGADQQTTDRRIIGNFTGQATIFKGLDFMSRFGVDANNHEWSYYLDPFMTNFGRQNHGLGRSDKALTNSWLWENTLGYLTDIKKNTIEAMIGSSMQSSIWTQTYLEGTNFPEDITIRELWAANEVDGGTRIEESTIASFFARAQYDYADKYYFTFSMRRDGSSKLAAENRWETMPSLSTAWRISAEPFMQGINFLDDLKLRFGWGRSGNVEGIPNYARFGLRGYSRITVPSGTPLSGPGSYQASYGNPDLKWETTDQTNLGFDLTMLNTRLTIAFDAYIKKTKDVLLNVILPSTAPLQTLMTNAGKIENRGIEFNIRSINIDNTFKWSTDFNMNFNRNEVTELTYTKIYFSGRIEGNSETASTFRVGEALGTFYGYIADGVNPETGDMIYRDLNGDGISDRTKIGSGQPDFTFGLTNTFNWKKLDLSIFLQGSVGNDIYNSTRVDLEGMFDSKNQSVAVLDRWTPENRNTDIPRAVWQNTYNVSNSTRFVEDGSYVRLKSATLSYRLLENHKFFKLLSLYISGENLITLTNYSGFDPEVNAFGNSSTELGIDYGTYPQARSLIFGINVQF